MWRRQGVPSLGGVRAAGGGFCCGVHGMSTIEPCRSYHGRLAGVRTWHMPDRRSVFKTYFVSIVGREERARYEWEHSAFSMDDLERLFLRSAVAGVGVVTAFPHITKVFRFAPAVETVLHVRALQTQTIGPLDLARADGYMEFACYAEAAIAADEYHAWARATTVAEYLACRSTFQDGPIADHRKLAAYWSAAPAAAG